MNLPEIEVIKKMVEKGLEKIHSSRELFESFCYNDSASRIYYGIFHILSAVLMTKNMSFSKHSSAIGAFNKEFIKTGIFPKDFHKKIEKLFINRQIGDYDFNQNISKETVLELFHDSEEMIRKTLDYLSTLYSISVDDWKNKYI